MDVVCVDGADVLRLGAIEASVHVDEVGALVVDASGPGSVELNRSGWARAVPAGRFDLSEGEALSIRHGDLALHFRATTKAPFLNPPLRSRIDYGWTNTLVLSGFLHALLASIALAAPKVDLADGQLRSTRPLFREVILIPEGAKPVLPGRDPAPASAGALGQVGHPDRPRPALGRRSSSDRDRPKIDRALTRLLGGLASPEVNVLVGDGGIGAALEDALSGVSGPELGDSVGSLGLGTRGEGPGQGGLAHNSVGLGALGTNGRWGGGDRYRAYEGGLGKKVERDIPVDFDDPVIVGGLDKSLIQRVIKDHISQIRYCFERALVRDPGLSGKITMSWIIGADGRTNDVHVRQTTVQHPPLEQCMASYIRTWRFPKPRGGGIVQVNYPFILHRSG